MNTKHKFNRMFASILSIAAILAVAFPAVGSAYAEEESPPALWRDEFDGPLAEGWYWVNENPDNWTFNDGFLSILASLYGTGGENLLLRSVAQGDFTIKTHLLFEPDTDFQIAGLVIWQDGENFLQFGRAFCDVEGACVGNGLYFDKVEGGNSMDGNFATSIDNPSDVFLRLERRGDMVKAFYSADEGISWYEIGTHWIPSDFVVNGVGLTASQDFNTPDWDIPADFDFFELTEGWGFLPEGFHDYDEGDVPNWACNAGGWAADPDNREADVNIEVVVDHQTVANLVAGEFRQDLLDAGVCEDGNCSFSTSLWDLISSYEPHRVDVWAQDDTGEWVLLSNSAKTLTCRTYDIYTFDPGTGETIQITNLRETDEYNPSWSPNGKLVAHDVVGGDFHSIYITNVKTGVSTPLAGADDFGDDAVWSPNGKWIVFDRVPAEDYSLYIVPAAGGVRALVREDAVSADWAPNGMRLVFQQPSDKSIRTVPVNGGKGSETLIAMSGANPVWSPDGNWIAFENDGDIWKVHVNVQGSVFSDPIQVTSGPFNDGQPTWLFDSMTIAYNSGFNEDWDIWTVPAEGGMGTWLTGAQVFGDYDPSYARNSSTVGYASFSPEGQAPRTWVEAFTYDAGTWDEGTHSYQFWAEGIPGGDGHSFDVSGDNPLYPGKVLIRPGTLRAETPEGCANIDVIHPEQQTQFHVGWIFDGLYADARMYFENLMAQVGWDAEVPEDMEGHEIFPLTPPVDWFGYTCTFIEAPPKMDLRVNYGHDWVESFYEGGHSAWVTVTDADGNVRATTELVTEPKWYWGGETGFQSVDSVWFDGDGNQMENPPDIQPYDWVYAQVDNGATAQVEIGDISGMIDLDADSIGGTINAPWFSDPVQVECLDWGSGQDPPFNNKDGGFVLTNGEDPYSCSWYGEWDIQYYQNVGVGYSGPDGHWVANAFFVANPHFTVFPEWEWFDGYDWPDGAIVTITVDNKSVCQTTGESWGGFFNGGFPEGCDIAVGDVVTFTDGDTVRTHTIRNLAITNVDKAANTVSGTANADWVYAWVHEYGYDMQLQVEDGTWLADFGSAGLDLVENMGGRAEIRDEFGNSTAADWWIPNPRFSVFPEWEYIEGWDWPEGVAVFATVEGKPICSIEGTSGHPEWDPNALFVPLWFPEGCDVAVGDVVTLTDGDVPRTHTVQSLAITAVDKDANTIMGAADPGALVHVWPHGYDELLPTAGEDGSWLADFNSIGIDLVEDMGGRTEIRDEIGNATAVEWYIPVPSNPRIVASITEDWFYLVDFAPDTPFDYSVYDSQQDETPISQGGGVTDGSGFAWVNTEGWDLEPGTYLVVSDGNTTKELVVEGFTFDVFDITNGHLEGTVLGQEGRHVWVGIGWENDGWSMDIATDETGAWFAGFGQPVPPDFWWVAAQIFDDDGDASELRPASQIIFLRPSCGDTYTVQAGSSLEIRYGSWIAIGEELANQNAEHLTVELLLNGETVTGTQQPVVPASEIPCGSPPEDAYGVFYVVQVAPLSPGAYVAQVTWSFDEAVTDGYDADGDGEIDWYGPGEVFTREFTIIVP